MGTFKCRTLILTAVLAGGCACSGPRNAVLSTSPLTRAEIAKMRQADRIDVLASWSGLGSPRSQSKRYIFRREGSAGTEGAGVPSSTFDAFLGVLADAPFVDGPYEPRMDRLDDYPQFYMTIGAGDDHVLFFSDSQGAGQVPWAIQIAGMQYVIPTDAPARAFDLLSPYLSAAETASAVP